jgi:hypothetical protein
VVEQAKLHEAEEREQDVRQSDHAVVNEPGPLIAGPELGASIPVDMLTLQRTAGNAAVGRLLARARTAGGGPPGDGDDELDAGLRVFVRSFKTPPNRAAIGLRGAAHSTRLPASQVLQRDGDDDKSKFQKAHDAFISAKTDAEIKFGLISQQQGATVQTMKEAALAKDPPPIELQVVAGIVGAAINAALPGIGGAIASLTTETLAQSAVKAAFAKGASVASKAATDAISSSQTQASVAETYFNGMALTYPALAGAEGDGFSASMDAVWSHVGSDATKAADAQKQAEEAKSALQNALSSKTYVQPTQDAAFSGLSNLLASQGAGGVLALQTTVGEKGNIGGKVIESAVVGGVSKKLCGIVAGHPLSAFQMAVSITASYFTERPKIGDTSESDVPVLHTFTVSVDSGGKAQPPGAPDQWLLDRGSGDATAGAQGLYDALKDTPIPVTSS